VNTRRRSAWRKASATVSIVLLFFLAACSGSDDNDEQSGNSNAESKKDSDLAAMLPDDVQQEGSITWSMEPFYPPFSLSEGDSNEVQGINVDLAHELSALFGVEANIQPGKFDGLIPGIQSERIDVGIATMADTKERRGKVDFVDYFQSGTAIFVKPENPAGINAMSDLCGKQVGVVKGTFQVNDAEAQNERCQKNGNEAMDIQVFDKQAGMLLALKSGRSEVMLMDYVAGSYAATTEGGDAFVQTGDIEDPQRKGMIVSKDRPELRDALQAAMQKLVENGRYEEVLEEWDQTGGALDTITINDGN